MKNRVVIVLIFVAIFALSLSLTGCSSAPRMTWGPPGMTSKEVDRRHYEAIQTDLWQIQDDIDAVFLFDRAGRLNRLSVR